MAEPTPEARSKRLRTALQIRLSSRRSRQRRAIDTPFYVDTRVEILPAPDARAGERYEPYEP